MIVNVEITVFTPTYNRAYIINRLYESLQRQEIHNFEWLVVDDGSVDETEELFRTWMNNESKFPIRYYKKKNGGKCRAINFALDLAKGKLFFVVDSDDYLTDDALKKIIAWEKSLPKDEKYCGVAGNLGMSSNFTPNTLFETDYYDGTLLDRYRNIDGERALAFFTEIHKKYRYPEYSGEKFMTEAVIYNRMANDGYKMRFYNDIVWIYEYRSDGLTKAGNSLFLNNPRGYGLWLKEKALFMNFSLIKRIKMYYTFSCDLIGKYSTKESGWSHYAYSVKFAYADKKRYLCKNGDDPFMQLFVKDYILRESCSSCHFKGYHRVSDITLGDFWGIWNINPKMDDNKGTSLILTHTAKGEKMMNAVSENIKCEQVYLEQAARENPSLLRSSVHKQNRDIVLKTIESENFQEILPLLQVKQPQRRSKKEIIKRVLKKLCGLG